ncbi:MAG: DinB family protein, partial [bacterium]
MPRPEHLRAIYDGWAEQQAQLVASIGSLSLEQMQLRAAPGEWAIWQLASNMAGGRLYWLCTMLGEDDRGLREMFRVDHSTVPDLPLEWAGWEDNTDRPRTAAELVEAFEKTGALVRECLERWTAGDLVREVTRNDAWGNPRTITPAWVI